MSSGKFYASEFDPNLICGQIALVQSLLYSGVGLWLLLLHGLIGRPASEVTLDQIFSVKAFNLSHTGGWISMAACFLNSLFGGCCLCIVVERAKKCLDFAATAHILHLGGCWLYDGWPERWEWWVVNLISLVVMALTGEYLSMRREMQDIPLGGYGAR